MTDEHEFEQQLTAVLERRATEASPSADGFGRIQHKVRARRRQKVLAIAAGIVILLVVAAAVVTPRGGGGGQGLDVVDDGEVESSTGLPGGDLLPALVDLEAALEEEMVIGAAYLASAQGEYEERISATDEAVAAVEEELASYEPSSSDDQGAADALETRLADLEVIRSGTLDQQLDPLTLIEQYGETADAVLDLAMWTSTSATSVEQAVLLNQALTVAFAGRNDATIGAILAEIAASSEQRFFAAGGAPCATHAPAACESWGRFEQAVDERNRAHDQLAADGLEVEAPPQSGEALAREMEDGATLPLSVGQAVVDALVGVDWYREQVHALLEQAAAAVPTTTPDGVRKADLDLYLAAVELERELRRETVVLSTGDAALGDSGIQAAQNAATTAATTEFSDAWTAAGGEGDFFEQTTDVRPPIVAPYETHLEALTQLAELRVELTDSVDDIELFRRLESLNTFLDGERAMALELAILSAVVARDPQLFTPEEAQQFLDALMQSDDAFLNWDRIATPEHRSLFRNETSGPEVREADDLVDRAFTARNEGSAIEPVLDRSVWVLAVQNKIDVFEAVEYAMIDALDDPPADPADPSTGVPLTVPDDTAATSVPPATAD